MCEAFSSKVDHTIGITTVLKCRGHLQLQLAILLVIVLAFGSKYEVEMKWLKLIIKKKRTSFRQNKKILFVLKK